MQVWKIVAPALEAWSVFVGSAEEAEAERVRQARKYERITRLEEIHPTAPEWREAATRAGMTASPPCIKIDPEETLTQREADAQLAILLFEAQRAGATERLAEQIRKVMSPHRVVHPERRINRYVRDPGTLMTCDMDDDPGPHEWPTWAAAADWIEAQTRAAAERGETLVERAPEPVVVF